MTNDQMNSTLEQTWFLCNGVNEHDQLFVRVKAKSYDWTEETVDFTDFDQLCAYIAS